MLTKAKQISSENSAKAATLKMPVPDTVCVSMKNGANRTACIPTVQCGDSVYVGTKIGESNDKYTAPIYSGVSGTVREIAQISLADGEKSDAVIIDADKLQTRDENIQPPLISSADDLINSARECGITDLCGLEGGENLPDTLIVNGMECEPYVTGNYKALIENTADIIYGICLMIGNMSLQKAVIAVNEGSQKAIDMLQNSVNKCEYPNKTEIMPLPPKYPNGNAKILIKTVTDRTVKIGQNANDVGCIVMSAANISALAVYAKSGMPQVSRRISVGGPALANSANIRVPVGAYIKDIVDQCGGYRCEPEKLILGGAMTGIALKTDDVPICADDYAILAFDERGAKDKPLFSCINCGRCASVCPMSLNPAKIERDFRLNDKNAIKNDGTAACIECGCCGYICPSARPLNDIMRQVKIKVSQK